VTDLRRWKNVVMNHKYPRCEEGWGNPKSNNGIESKG
jgi:hypothetical protein